MEQCVNKIKTSTLIALIESGGIGMIDVKACNLTVKGSWVKRLLNERNAKWKDLTWYMLNVKMICKANSLKVKETHSLYIFFFKG